MQEKKREVEEQGDKMYKQIITLIPDRDYKIWCDGKLVVLREVKENSLIFYKDISDVKTEFKISKDDLVGISLQGGKDDSNKNDCQGIQESV